MYDYSVTPNITIWMKNTKMDEFRAQAKQESEDDYLARGYRLAEEYTKDQLKEIFQEMYVFDFLIEIDGEQI